MVGIKRLYHEGGSCKFHQYEKIHRNLTEDGKRNIRTIEIGNRLNCVHRQRLFRTNGKRQFPFSALESRGKMKAVVPRRTGFDCRVNRRDNGPTARATEVREPAILANSRYEEDLSRIAELRRLLSFRTLASGIWKVMATVLITKPSHSPICTGSQWDYPHSRENPKS